MMEQSAEKNARRNISEETQATINEIIRQSRDSIEYFCGVGVDNNIIRGIHGFTRALEDNGDEVCIANGKLSKGTNKKSFNRKNIMNIFCDNLDPALSQITDCSYMQLILSKAGLWPLRDGLLKSESLADQLKKLKSAISYYEKILLYDQLKGIENDNQAQRLNIKTTLESLQLLWEVLSILNNAKSFKPQLKQAGQLPLYWCKCCFRRKDKSLMYCRVHASQNNTEQGRAERIREKLPPDAKKQFKRYQTMRTQLGDDPVFLETTSDTREADYQSAYIIRDMQEFDFFRRTITEEWTELKDIWIDSIESQLPFVTAAISRTGYKEAESWSQFVAALFHGLEEKHETTNHPFWIKKILEIAEIWFFYEDRCGDGRKKTETSEQILGLHQQGKSVKEIKVIVGKSKSLIYRIIKENPV